MVLQYKNALENVRTVPSSSIDAHGPVGAVVFWHGRIGHEAGPNYGAKIRQAIRHDFSREDLEETDTCPPSESMWRDWSPQVQAIAAANGHDALPLTDPVYAPVAEGAVGSEHVAQHAMVGVNTPGDGITGGGQAVSRCMRSNETRIDEKLVYM